MKIKIIIVRGEALDSSPCFVEILKKFSMYDISYIDIEGNMEEAFSLAVKTASLDSLKNPKTHYLIIRDSSQTYSTRRTIVDYLNKLENLDYDIAMLCRWGSKLDGDKKIEGNIYAHDLLTATQALSFSPRCIGKFSETKNFLEDVHIINLRDNLNIYSVSPNLFNFDISLSSTKGDLYRENMYWESAIKKDRSSNIIRFIVIVIVIFFTAWAVYHVRDKKFLVRPKS